MNEAEGALWERVGEDIECADFDPVLRWGPALRSLSPTTCRLFEIACLSLSEAPDTPMPSVGSGATQPPQHDRANVF